MERKFFHTSDMVSIFVGELMDCVTGFFEQVPVTRGHTMYSDLNNSLMGYNSEK